MKAAPFSEPRECDQCSECYGGRGEGQTRAVGNGSLGPVSKQDSREQEAGGGPKSGSGEEYAVPTNCDHVWQEDGYIGNQ